MAAFLLPTLSACLSGALYGQHIGRMALTVGPRMGRLTFSRVLMTRSREFSPLPSPFSFRDAMVLQ